MDSAVWRLRRVLVFSLLAFTSLSALPVRAQETPSLPNAPAKIAVTVQPVNGVAQKVTCSSDTYKCALPVTIQTGANTETLTVDVFYVPGNVQITFKTPDGYVYAGDKPQADPKYPMYSATWGRQIPDKTPIKADISLFEPVVPNPVAAPWLATPGKAVADLELSLGAAP